MREAKGLPKPPSVLHCISTEGPALDCANTTASLKPSSWGCCCPLGSSSSFVTSSLPECRSGELAEGYSKDPGSWGWQEGGLVVTPRRGTGEQSREGTSLVGVCTQGSRMLSRWRPDGSLQKLGGLGVEY